MRCPALETGYLLLKWLAFQGVYLFSHVLGVLYYVKQLQRKLELAKWIMFTSNEQFSVFKTMTGCVEHIQGKYHMFFASRVNTTNN